MKICGWQSFAIPVSGMLGGGIQLHGPAFLNKWIGVLLYFTTFPKIMQREA